MPATRTRTLPLERTDRPAEKSAAGAEREGPVPCQGCHRCRTMNWSARCWTCIDRLTGRTAP